MAEGFFEPLKETILDVVVERYLTGLICRGLLQVARRNASGRPKAFKMHDILREFAVSISKSIKFVAKSDGKEEVEDDGIRCWSVEAKENEMKAASETALSRVRSVFVFAVDETSKSSLNRLPSGFKLMRVLDFEDTPINELPDEGQEFTTLPHVWESLPHLNEVCLFEVSSELIEKICRSKGMHRQTITSIVLSRQEDTEAEFKIMGWCE